MGKSVTLLTSQNKYSIVCVCKVRYGEYLRMLLFVEIQLKNI